MTDPHPAARPSSIARRLSPLSVIGPPLLVFAILCALALGSMQLLSAVRSYVVGESLWSKARAGAVQHLLAYTDSGQAADHAAFEASLRVPDGDRAAREAMNRRPADWERARAGFIAGGNHPDDVDAMIALYLLFGRSWLFEDAHAAWEHADSLMDELRREARGLQALGPGDNPAHRASVTRIEQLNLALLAQERRFLICLNHAARLVEWILQAGMMAMVALVSMLYLVVARRALLRQRAHESAEHARAQLALQRDAAQKVASSQRAFLSRLSHELRTPLNAILGFAQLLGMNQGEHPLSSSQQQQVHWILRAGRQLLALVEEVLDLSKVESGELRMNPQDVEVQEALRACLPLVESVRQQRQVQVEDLLPQAPLRVHADPHRLQQVFINLLSNACKYNRPGGVVRLQARPEGDRIVIDISDTGPGLPESALPELFQPFKRIGPLTQEVEGTGLGLYIVRQLLERMQGQVSVRSREGEGTCFSVQLPRDRP